MKLEHHFVMSDESLNAQGFRVLTEGLDLQRFLKNPVAFWNHDQNGHAIGRWKDVRKQDGQLVGTLEFDPDDELALKIYHKVKRGYVNAVSVGLRALRWSEEESETVAGQVYKTLAESELVECSPCGVPANANAVSLFDEQGHVRLNLNGPESALPKLPDVKLAKVAALVGLEGEPTEEALLEGVKHLRHEMERALSEIADLRQAEKQRETLLSIDEAVKAEKLPAGYAAYLKETAANDWESAKKFVESLPERVRLSALPERQAVEDPTQWSWDDFQTRDPRALETLRESDWERFSELYRGKYGVPPAR